MSEVRVNWNVLQNPKNKFRLGQAMENKPMVARVPVSFGHSKVNQGQGTTLVAFYFGD